MSALRFAYLLLGPGYSAQTQRADFESAAMQAALYGVGSVDEACALARTLAENGVQCIELCGAFGEAGAERIIAATGGEVAVGYSVHLLRQDALFDRLFGPSDDHT